MLKKLVEKYKNLVEEFEHNQFSRILNVFIELDMIAKT